MGAFTSIRQAVSLMASTALLLGCKTAQLSGGGAQVATSSAAPVDSGWDPSQCESLGYVIGRGGGAFGGGWVSNEGLIEYAMNDLRNKASEMGANFIQHDTPTMGQAGGDDGSATTTATVSGTAYKCEGEPRGRTTDASADEVSSASKSVCTPGATQPCTGPGGCSGGQSCVDDGSKFSPCDCGSSRSEEASSEPE
jgi:hypothetical protein